MNRGDPVKRETPTEPPQVSVRRRRERDYRILQSDFCSKCGALVLVLRMVEDDGEMRPLVRCSMGHEEVQ